MLAVDALDDSRSGVIREFMYRRADGNEERTSEVFQEFVAWLA